MRNKAIFLLAGIGLLIGLLSAYLFGVEKKPQPPAFTPASNPYGKGIYANGIIESRISKAVGKLLKDKGTARNWATVEKLQAMRLSED